MMYRMLVLVAVAFFGLTSLGCHTVNTVDRNQTITTDSTLAAKAKVLEVREGSVGNGLLKIQVHLKNTYSTRKRFNYRFDWVDGSGMAIDTPLSNWKSISLAGKESVWISAVAPTPKTADYRLKLIEAGH